MPLLIGLAAVLAGVALWDRWGDVTGEPAAPEAAAAPRAAASAVRERAAPGPFDLRPVDADAAPRRTSASLPAHPLAGLALDQLHDTVRRPLFEKGRRPVEPPATRASSVPAPAVAAPRRTADPNALTLLGVLVSDNRSGAIALVSRRQTGQNLRLQEGDTVDGWTVDRIEPERVLLSQGDDKIALQLFSKR